MIVDSFGYHLARTVRDHGPLRPLLRLARKSRTRLN
jgi:hypothetical protein